MQTEFGVPFIVTGACQNNFSLLSICNRCFVWLIFLRLGYILITRPYKYNLELPLVTIFLLLSHLPRLDLMVANFFMCEQKVINLIYCPIYIFIFINNQGRQHKMLWKRPVSMKWLPTICLINFFVCKRKEEFLLHISISPPLVAWNKKNINWIISSYHIIQLSNIIVKSKVMPPPGNTFII